MNHTFSFRSVFLMTFLCVVNAPSIILADANEPGSRLIDYVPECMRADRQLSDWWQKRQEKIARENAILYVGEKPQAIQVGHYQHGRYVQFTLDMRAFCAGMLAGSCFRGLYSVATCGTEYKKFKQAAFTPGVAKSLLFWVPAVAAYQFSVLVNLKKYEDLARAQGDNSHHGLDRTHEYNPHNQFGQ